MKIEDYNKYYIQGSDHYLIPKDIFNELFDEMSNWKEDTKKYKEVIDKAINNLNIIIDIVREQPTEDDRWILDRLNGFKIILEDKEVSE